MAIEDGPYKRDVLHLMAIKWVQKTLKRIVNFSNSINLSELTVLHFQLKIETDPQKKLKLYFFWQSGS